MQRREFLKTGLVGAGATVTASAAAAPPSPPAASPTAATAAATATATATSAAATGTALDPHALMRVTDPGERRGDMLYRTLGRTGEKVSLIGMGGFHLGKKPLDPKSSAKLIHAGLDRGITFLDNSWDYNSGNSEKWMGAALAEGGYRKKAFLMTKIDGRTKQEAAKQLDESLRRLKTDMIDLVQHHEIIRFDDPDKIFGEGGAMEALVAAKQAGKVRFIGYTGHKDPRIHLYMLEVAKRKGFDFDTVQMPLNVFDASFRSFSHLVVPAAVKANIGILGMKALAGGVMLKSGAPVSPIDCLHYAMNLPTSVVITGIDSSQILDQAFEAVKTFKPMTGDQVAELVGKAKPYAAEGQYELFKTSSLFDSTAKHPDWLGDEVEGVKKIAAHP